MDHPADSTVLLSKAELLLAMQNTCAAFLGFYIGEDLTLEIPDFHEHMWDELLILLQQANLPGATYQLRKLFAVPREHSKSTLAKLAVILFIRFSPLSFVLYVSKTNGMAMNAIRDILTWLSSEQEREMFGPMQTLKSSENESLWIVNITIRRSFTEAPWVKTVIFRALGADQHVRGTLIRNRRPQIVVIDDIEDLDNTTETQQPKLDEWMMGTLLKAFDSQRQIVIFIGNMIRKTTLLARLSKEPQWNATVYGSIVRDKANGQLRPLWRGKNTVEGLLAEYRYYQRMGVGHLWEAEMMNLTHDEVLEGNMSGAVRPPMPLPEDLTAGALVLDPAFGQNAWNDFSSITVHARIEGVKVPVIIEVVTAKMTEDQIFDSMLELSYRWGISTWFIESEAAQKVLISYFTLLMRDRKLNTDALMILPVGTGKKNKGSRIKAMAGAVAKGSYGVVDALESLVESYRTYDPANPPQNDDDIDSGAYGLVIWQLHGELIDSNGIKQMALAIHHQSGEAIAARFGYRVLGI